MCLERRANLFLSLHQNITRILRVQLTLVKQMCSSKVLASPAHARLLFDTQKRTQKILMRFDTPAWSISTLDAQNLDVCDSLPEFYPIFRPASLWKFNSF